MINKFKKAFVNKSNAQAALEFLMTYGWAIFIVLVALGVLSYFGVFNLALYLPDKCVGQPGLDCTDMKSVRTDGEILFQLKNNLGQSINLTDGSTTGGDDDCELSSVLAANGKQTPAYSLADGDITIQNSEYASILLSCGFIKKGRFTVNLNLKYKNLQTENEHTAAYMIKGFAGKSE